MGGFAIIKAGEAYLPARDNALKLKAAGKNGEAIALTRGDARDKATASATHSTS